MDSNQFNKRHVVAVFEKRERGGGTSVPTHQGRVRAPFPVDKVEGALKLTLENYLLPASV
jgi:hypothetical protein